MKKELVIRLEECPLLFQRILNCLTYIEGSNNYYQNIMFVNIYSDMIEVETAFENKYGGLYGNNDLQVVSKSDLPNFVARKLYGVRS